MIRQLSFVTILLSLFGANGASAQPWSAGVEVFAPVQPALPLARGIDTDHEHTYAFAARIGRTVSPPVSVGGSVGYRYSESLNTIFVDPDFLVQDKLGMLSVGPFVRYERPVGTLIGIGEFALDGGILFLGGKTRGLNEFYEVSQNYMGYSVTATPRLGLAYAPADRVRVELLASYRLGFVSIETMTGDEEESCTACGPRFDWRREDRAGLSGGFDLSLGVRYALRRSTPRDAATPASPRRHALYTEAGGSALFFSINYEHDLIGAPGGLYARLGGGGFPGFPGQGSGFGIGTVALGAVAPGEARRLAPEISVGLVALTTESEIVPTISAGFRLVRPRWFMRIVATTLHPKARGDYETGRDTYLLPGLSVGVPL